MNRTTTIRLSKKDFELQMLTVGDLHDIGAVIFDDRKKELIEDGTDAGLDEEQLFKLVRDFREEWSNGVEVLRAAYTASGAKMFLEKAFLASGLDTEVVANCNSLRELVAASAKVCDLPDPFAKKDSMTDEELENAEIVPDDQ